MNALHAPVHVCLALAGPLRERVRGLEADAFERFTIAWAFAERVLGRSAEMLEGEMNYLVPCAGILLAVRFHPRREQFLIVGFEDFGNGPNPTGGQTVSIDVVGPLLEALGAHSPLSVGMSAAWLSQSSMPYKLIQHLVSGLGNDTSQILKRMAEMSDCEPFRMGGILILGRWGLFRCDSGDNNPVEPYGPVSSSDP